MSKNGQPTDINNITSGLIERSFQCSPRDLRTIANEWAQAIVSELGVDDGTRDLTPLVTPYIDQINAKCASASAKVILNELSEAVEAQYELAEYIDKSLQNNTYHGTSITLFSDPTYPEAQWIKDPVNLISFLKNPLSDDSVAAFISQQPMFPADRAKQFHQDYWALNNNQRAEFIGKVFNVGDSKRDRGYRDFLKQAQTMLDNGLRDEFLPPENLARGDDSAYQIGSKIMKAMMMSPPPPKLMLKVFASLMDAVHDDALDQASEHPRTLDPQERFGYRLGKFMNNLGPGAAKVAQFGHSLPVTPDAWMEGLAGSKSNAGRPSRLEYLAWFKKSVPEEMQQHVRHIGAHKGTGSYLSTYGVDLDPEYIEQNDNYARYRKRYAGKGLVLSIKKPNAREEAFEFTDYLLELGEKIAHFSPEAAKSVAPLLELIKQGKDMVVKETDLNYSARQEDVVAQLHDNLKVIAGSYMVDYYTQGAFDYGEDFRVSLCIDGKHFNELPESTASEKAIKRHAALSLFTPALYIMLSGKPFNHDDHGDNNGITVEENALHVGKFDSGAQALDQPTTEQKIVFADCLVNALVNSARNKYSPLSSLKHTIAKTAAALGPDRSEELEYINSMLRASMSLGDYMHHMKSKDYIHAFLAVAETGDIDPVILSRLTERIAAVSTTKGGDFVKTLPIIGAIAQSTARAAEYTGLSRWTGTQTMIEDERAQETAYYAYNPNPNRRTNANAQVDGADDKKNRPPKEHVPAIKVHIENEGEENAPGFTARVLSTVARQSKRFVK